jgi:uncharacterized Zn-binding protein involved in type VI secretion
MPKPAAKEDDTILATDIHLVNGSPMPLPFTGTIDGSLSATVIVEHKAAAVVGSSATNSPGHLPPPGKTFDKPPTNRGVVVGGSSTVLINDRSAARDGDPAATCNDPTDLPAGTVVASSTVIIGG